MSGKKKLLEKFKAGKSMRTIIKWAVTGLITASFLSLLIYYGTTQNNSETILDREKTTSALKNKNKKKNISNSSLTESETEKGSLPIFYNPKPSGSGVQEIKTILKENADCSSAILVIDSILFSPNSPKGFGNIIEIKDNKPDDTLYFEKEHNTIWYKFTAKESGNLTFDIIPLNQNDDYDFILYRYNGKDFSTKVINKEIKPLRTCISRNEIKLKSMTGLSLDETSKRYIHSGLGASYVKYVRVKKGEIFYLVVDNVNNNGNGHSIRFHYKTFASGELYPGLTIPFNQIKFMDSDYKFLPGSKKPLDSLYQFLIDNPKLKIEIQGHVNSSGRNKIAAPRGEHYNEMTLSEKRATAIYDFLVSKGIDSKRLFSKGYGSTRMINPKAKTREECFMNIRAEIVILSLDYKKEIE